MHPCLEVPEILHAIFTLIDNGSPRRAARHDMLSLALTCHYFSEFALDILWKTQSNLVLLIKTLPNRCWEEKPDTGFDRTFTLTEHEPTDDEYQRLLSYARHIRRLNYLPYPFHRERLENIAKNSRDNISPLDLSILNFLWTTKHDKAIPFFPNLLRLEFVNVTHAAGCLDVFLQTKGVSLSLQWSDSDGSVTSLFPTIERYALNMEELDLGPLQDSKREKCAHLSRLISKMKDLRRLSCASRVLEPFAIQHLASLPHLQSLQIANTPGQILHALSDKSLSGPLFPELYHLVIPDDYLCNFSRLLKHLRPLHLRDISLHIRKMLPNLDLYETFQTLERAGTQLSNIHRIAVKYSHHHRNGTRRRQDFDVLPMTYIRPSTLEPLLSFKCLTVLEFDLPCRIDLGDIDLIKMADAWPFLQRLHLGSMGEWNLPHLVTYNGFLHLLRSCPELEHLAFSFNASSGIPTLTEIAPECVNEKITYLYVGDSNIGENTPESVAKFFARILPKLCGIGGRWLSARGSAEQWDYVVKTLKKSKLYASSS